MQNISLKYFPLVSSRSCKKILLKMSWNTHKRSNFNDMSGDKVGKIVMNYHSIMDITIKLYIVVERFITIKSGKNMHYTQEQEIHPWKMKRLILDTYSDIATGGQHINNNSKKEWIYFYWKITFFWKLWEKLWTQASLWYTCLCTGLILESVQCSKCYVLVPWLRKMYSTLV